jgi:hypothetical protein
MRAPAILLASALAAGPQASVAVLYDSTRDFPSSVGPMLRQLHGGADPASPAAQQTPAEPMQQQSFADGTGSIDLPADWRLLSGGGGSAAAIGPTGEVVSYNSVLTGMDPNNPKAQQYLRTMPAQVLNARRQSMAVVPYTADPVQAFNALFRQLAAQNGKAPPGLVVRRSTPVAAEQGQDFMARMGEHQDQMTRAAVAMENYVLDRRVVVDTGTGARGTIDAGLADALVHVDPRFELVPPSRLLRGVDY